MASFVSSYIFTGNIICFHLLFLLRAHIFILAIVPEQTALFNHTNCCITHQLLNYLFCAIKAKMNVFARGQRYFHNTGGILKWYHIYGRKFVILGNEILSIWLWQSYIWFPWWHAIMELSRSHWCKFPCTHVVTTCI